MQQKLQNNLLHTSQYNKSISLDLKFVLHIQMQNMQFSDFNCF